MENSTRRNSVSIVRIAPPLLERGQIWFAQNIHNIRKEAKKQTSWWSANYLELEQDEVLPISGLMRKFDDWGYVKVTTVRNPGEFANRGGIIDVFPINEKTAVRLEYDGNAIETINILPDVRMKDPEKKLKNLVTQKPQFIKVPTFEKRKQQEDLINSLKKGTYVVHVDHGIARFAGQGTSLGPSEGPSGKYLILEYAEKDMLYVPLTVADRVSPYIGFTEPHLTRLGGNLWEKTKRKVKEDLIKTARELVAIYAQRELAQRDPYEIDNSLIHPIEESFNYQETKDQLTAIDDILKDLQSSSPMDRIICGDVGFGKTEVALRAAAAAVSAGYQVAVVAPTTILAHQHYKTFTARFPQNHPIRIRKLTRIEKRAEQKEIIEDLGKNKCDIIIGTHRLLQKDVHFAHLGLLIIDEEQRFGVKQKEYFKKRRAELDILSLSATPIPRTLSFALSGLRDINVITTPPYGRLPIQTKVVRFNKKIIKDAIEKELARGGQVFFLHNRIPSLQYTVDNLKKLVGDMRIEYMHAKLPEEELIKKIDSVAEGTIDVLVTTTIMENGLDLANANTLIVDDATKLGLAQAHQIRGRIGRGDKQAFAYFLYPSRKLAPKPKARLRALQDAQHLGAGYQIALRDLEIRGGGNFLGREQSGNIAKVGFNLYCQLLNEAIEEIRNKNHESRIKK